MFKKVYKAAIDDIKPNRELIDVIFEKANEDKPKKTAVIYKYGMAIAAVCVLAVSIYSFPQIAKYSGINSETAKVSETSNMEPTTENVTNQLRNVQPIKADTDKIETASNNDLQRTPAMYNASDVVANSTNKARAEKMQEAGIHTEWTINQYYEYLGINIDDVISLPDGMENTTGETVYVTTRDDVVENDRVTISFMSEGRNVLIETSKLYESGIGDEKNCKKMTVDSVPISVHEINTNEYEAVFKFKDVYFKIFAIGINENELTDIIGSLMKA